MHLAPRAVFFFAAMPQNPTPPDPRDNALFSSIVLRVPRGEKGDYLQASRAAGQTLADWIRCTLQAELERNPLPPRPPKP